ncbi:deazaflavin-dependent oxidoreductase (nitroreductase family) [Streptomyces sp. TLI_55]|uniref:nitroreductase/quinone reductase family protein n=1 Tax=Streptomyces sp. TLI_55 TaxID=1938861 RepID=UPI000BD1C06A|nr:nitroreductase/quinone reductase family protein [Streptomyces sp. TLI_55]SNX62168.1 deazaflavin-dependent oxidoreductase (nitroreductase family) [Streptomyces sp. TLI_55]
MPNDFNQQVIDEFRAHNGRVGGWFEGGRLLLLTTTGARTGARHTTPLGYLPDGGDRVLVIASAGGSTRHPDWYRNILAHPQVTVEAGAFTYEAQAVVLEGEERDRSFARAVEADRGWAEYQEKAGDRVLPVVALYEVAAPGPPNIRAGSAGEAIKLVHDNFRHELDRIRAEMRKSDAGAPLGAQLRVNCLTFCQGLHNHHTGEDKALFPFVADRHPAAAPALARLREEHERIAELVLEIRQVVWTAGEPGTALAEFERLATELEAHLTYEEEQLIPLLGG